MPNNFLEPVNNSDTLCGGVYIRNPYTNLVEFYEIKRPYIITREYFNLTGLDVRIAQIGPGTTGSSNILPQPPTLCKTETCTSTISLKSCLC